MAEEVISHVDFVIDADGFRKTGELLGTMDKYMERVQRRAETLSRLTIMPKIRLNDCLCEPLKQIRSKLDMLTKTDWIIRMMGRFLLDTSIIDSAGLVAGRAFSAKFLEAFDTDKTAEKLKESLNNITVNVNLNNGSSSNEKTSGWEKILDFGLDILSGTISGYVSNRLSTGKRTRKHPPSPEIDEKVNLPTSKSRIQLPGMENKPQTLIDVNGRPLASSQTQTAAPPSASKPGKGKGVFSFGRNILNRIGGPKDANLGFSSTSHPMGFGLASGSSTKGLAKAVLKTGGKLFRPLSVISDISNISTAKPGKERNKAVGGALGGWGGAAAGAAIGSVVPVVGTVIGGAIGGLAGSFAGEWIGKNVGSVTNKASKWLGGIFGSKKKEVDSAPITSASVISAPSALPANPGRTPAGTSQQPNSVAIHINLPVGAVQLKVEDRLNYDELSGIIGSKIAVSIRQAMENRV